MHIVGISGSLRKKSLNTALLRALSTLAPADATFEILTIAGLPLYDQDIEEASYPAVARELREKIRSADGVIIATPEYNRSMPGALKNFLDWTSRPESEPNPWSAKRVGVLGASSGPRGASFAQYDVRRILHYFDAKVINQPEIYMGSAQTKFDDTMNLTDERTAEQLRKLLATFAASE